MRNKKIALDGGMLARFHNEVRIARQVAHPNVCRVYDIGEVDGLHFISMEFIDGEDLASLLRRIGRLPGDKAVEIARQICAGLAAAHEKGVLHRDLKPANVMIDGRGRARITDFGFAVVSEELREEDVLAGTPAYMAPEQLTGKEVTQRSDIYSLGLVLYELFTGKRVYETQNIHELIELHDKSSPATPSSHVKDIDPLAERVILRCLEKDPKARPASAVQVALALPGGDPLQAALAMGETPSPEMVAAAGEKTGLRPMIAVACLVAVLASLVALAFLSRRVSLIERIPFENSPEVLAGKGREAIAQLGYPERPFDRAYGLYYDYDYLQYVETDKAPDRWRQLESGRGGAVHLWYRESPNHLQPLDLSEFTYAWTVDDSDPPPSLPGMRGVKLDTLGRLREFYARPPQVDEAASGEASAPDWNRLFILADLDPSRFSPAKALWNPESVFDARAAWTGTVAEMPDIPLRVEAAGYHGRVVFFKLIGPWTKPNQARQNPSFPSHLSRRHPVRSGFTGMAQLSPGERRPPGRSQIGAFWLGWPNAMLLGLIFSGVVVLTFIRFGLLVLSASLLFYFWLNSLPFTTNLSAWYAGTSLFVVFIVTALASYAFYTSLGGQKVFEGKLLED